MSVNIVLLALVATLYSAGVYLLLERSLTRLLLGVLLLGNATNLLVLSAGGPAGGPPIVGVTPDEDMSDPLAQAMILTSIVISLGIAAFLLAMIYRNWVLENGEDISPDVEDVRIARERFADSELDLDPGEQSYDSGDDTDTGPPTQAAPQPAQQSQSPQPPQSRGDA
jgi:multicomponent Na+:H+ antiporter subunit C